MSPFAFPTVPADPTGGWSVALPAGGGSLGNRIGEVLLYAEGTGAPSPYGILRWPLNESGFPLAEINGIGPSITSISSTDSTAGTTMGFGRASLRVDDFGTSVTEDTGHNMLTASTPTTFDRDGIETFTLAVLIGQESLSAASQVIVGLAGICTIERIVVSGTNVNHFHIFDGDSYEDVSTYSGTPSGATFVALRVGPGGVWKRWVGTDTASGTFGTYAPGDDLSVGFFINDHDSFLVQEINLWTTAASDAEIEALRLLLVGV